MKLLILQAIISVMYLFDVTAYPLVHVSLYLLTALYLVSILEVFGMFRLARWFLDRFPQLRRYAHRTRTVVQLISFAAHFSLWLGLPA